MEKKFSHRAAFSVAVTAGLFGLGYGVADAANAPIALSAGSFNYNTVVTAGTPGSSATIVGGNPAAVDTENGISYWASSYNSSGALPPAGTPFTSGANSSTQFEFQPYTGNNTLLINADQKYSNGTSPSFAPPYSQSGTLTLATPGAYTSLAVLYTAAGQNYYGTIPAINYTLNFSDGTSYNNSGAASFTGQSWNTNANVATSGYRVWVNPNSNYGKTSQQRGWYMHEADITIPTADATKALTSISFFDSGSGYYNSPNSNNGGDPNSLAIYALSGAAAAVIPPMTYQGNATGHQGSWDTTSLNFLNESVNPPTTIAYVDGANVTFDDTATGPTAVTIAATVSPLSVTFNNNTKNYTFSGAGIAGPGGVTLTGTGSVTLNNSNSYIGATNISSGTLVIGAGGSVASSSVLTGTAATLSLTGGGALTSTSLNLTGGGTVSVTSPSSLTVSAGTFTGTMTGTGPVTFSGATFQVGSQAAFNLSSGITIGSATTTGTLLIADTSDTSAGIVGGVPATATVYGAGTGGLGVIRGADGITTAWAGNVAIGSTGATLSGGAGGTLNLTGSISGPSSSPVVFGANSNSTIILSGSNTYSGETQLGSNGIVSTLKLGAPNAIPSASGLNFSSGSSTLDLNGQPVALPYITGTSAGAVITNTGAADSLITLRNTTTAGFAGAINDGPTNKVAISFTGTGNQIFSGASNFSGGTTISTGTVTAAAPTSLGTGTVTLSGGTLSLTLPANSYRSVVSGLVAGSAPTQFAVNLAGNSSSGVENITSGTLTLTDTSTFGQATTAFTNGLLPIGSNGFTTSFTYNASGRSGHYAADGATFTLQDLSPNAVGGGANGLGYAGLANSAAVELNLYAYNSTVGTIFQTGGQVTTSTSYLSVTSPGIGTEPINVTLTYNPAGQTLMETLVGQTSGGVYTHTYTGVNLSSIVGSNTAYIGFTGATGGDNSNQAVSNFSYGIYASGASSIANNVIATAGTSSTIQVGVASGGGVGGIGSLTIGTRALVSLTTVSTDGSATRGVFTTTGLTLAGTTGAWTGKLDIGKTDMVVQNAGATGLAQIGDQIKLGANLSGAPWQGSGGITSSAAAADSTFLTAVGSMLNSNAAGQIYGSGTTAGLFDGANPGPNDVLIKFTYYGDANLDGAVDGSDYTLIDAGFNSNGTLSGWYNGDFNYDGKIDGSDYTLIDNAFNTQGASLGSNPLNLVAASTAQLAGQLSGTSAVPEPTSLAVLGVGAAGLLQRRRRK